MKLKARHLITGAIGAALFFAVVANVPSMTVTEATSERVIVETGSVCKYDLWLYHAPLSCNPLEGPRVISATYFSKGTFYWDAIDLEAPEVGDLVCGKWACVDRSGEFAAIVTGSWRVFLPAVYNE